MAYNRLPGAAKLYTGLRYGSQVTCDIHGEHSVSFLHVTFARAETAAQQHVHAFADDLAILEHVSFHCRCPCLYVCTLHLTAATSSERAVAAETM